MIKSKIMGWTGHIACMGVKRNAYSMLGEKSEGSCKCGNEHLGSIKCWEVLE
jgi:hypothetical protein